MEDWSQFILNKLFSKQRVKEKHNIQLASEFLFLAVIPHHAYVKH